MTEARIVVVFREHANVPDFWAMAAGRCCTKYKSTDYYRGRPSLAMTRVLKEIRSLGIVQYGFVTSDGRMFHVAYRGPTELVIGELIQK